MPSRHISSVLAAFLLLPFLLLIASCGGGSSSGSAGTVVGGAVQGKTVEVGGVVTTFAGQLPGSPDGIGTSARFFSPSQMVAVGDMLYVVDAASIRAVNPVTGSVTLFAGRPGEVGTVNGDRLSARFRWLTSLASDGRFLYVADYGVLRAINLSDGMVTTIDAAYRAQGDVISRYTFVDHLTVIGETLYFTSFNSVLKRDAATGEISIVAGGTGSFESVDGIGEAASFRNIGGMTSDGRYLYVTDVVSLRKVDTVTQEVTTIRLDQSVEGDGTQLFEGITGIGSVTVKGDILYMAAGLSVRSVSLLTGAVSTLAGTGTYSRGEVGRDGIGSAATFQSIWRGMTHSGDSLYVVDGDRIRRINLLTAEVSTIAGGADVSGYADGRAGEVKFGSLWHVATDGKSLYVPDGGNSVIRRIDLKTGTVTTFAGSADVHRRADGVGAAAGFMYPVGITTDGKDLYVTDAGDSSIRKVNIATRMVTTIAGQAGIGYADGPGLSAQFNFPVAVTTDGKSLFVADRYNSKLRKLDLASGIVSTVADGGEISHYDTLSLCTDGKVLFVAGSEALWSLDIASGVISRLTGTSFWGARGITTDGSELFILRSHAVMQFDPATGRTTAIAGAFGTFGSSDGKGALALFHNPVGITTDGRNLFIADGGNGVIRRIR